MCQTAKSCCSICPFPRTGMSGADSSIPSTHQQLSLNWVPNKVKARNNGEQNKDWEGKDPEGNVKTSTWAMRWWMKKFLSHCGVKWRPWPCHHQHCHHLESKTTARTAQSDQPPVSFQKKMRNQPPTASEVTSTALPCRHTPGLLQLHLVITVWPQAPAQLLVLEQEAQQNSCRREIPAYQSVQATSLHQPRKERGKSVQPSLKGFPHHRCQPTTAGLIFHQCQQEKEE